MKMSNLTPAGFVLLTLFLICCGGYQQQNVEVTPAVDDMARVLVVNGEIEKGQAAWIELGYTEDIDSPATTAHRHETGATVTIAVQGGASETLVHRSDGRYEGSTIKGEVGKAYTVTVVAAGKTYTATTTMLPETAYVYATVDTAAGSSKVAATGKKGSTGYSEEFAFKDDPTTRNRYLMEWWVNGVHQVRLDWAIDDNRVVNTGGKLKLFNPVSDPSPNQHLRYRVAEIDKITYDYYNMYEKIMRSLIGVGSVTPYNPVSNFGKGTVGNLRAVAFAQIILVTPPNPCAVSPANSAHIDLTFPSNSYFKKYNLYGGTAAGVTKKSQVMADIKPVADPKVKGGLLFSHKNLLKGTTYYYRIEVEDGAGNVSPLSPELSATVGDGKSACAGAGGGKVVCKEGQEAKKGSVTYLCKGGTWVKQ